MDHPPLGYLHVFAHLRFAKGLTINKKRIIQQLLFLSELANRLISRLGGHPQHILLGKSLHASQEKKESAWSCPQWSCLRIEQNVLVLRLREAVK
jgi:hypothetical protein